MIADEPTGNLDSKTGEQILGLFRQLNREDGLTIILVTHDPTVAAHASRIIRMRDGLVFDDDCSLDRASVPRRSAACGEVDVPEVKLQPSEEPRSHEETPMLSRRTSRDDVRFLVRTTSTALRSLRRNALRRR